MNLAEIFEGSIVKRKTIWTKDGNTITKRSVDVLDKLNIEARTQYEIKKEKDNAE